MSTSDNSAHEFGDIQSLTRGMKCHDEDAWRTFHAVYFRRLLRYLTVVLRGDEDAAGECVQQTFLRVVRHIKVFELEPDFWRWLACLARCTATDHQRARKRYLKFLEKLDHSMEMRRDPEIGSQGLDERTQALRALISAWRHEDQTLFRQKYAEGWTYSELAREHGLTEKAVESRLGRLRQRLRAHLAGSIRDEIHE